MSFWLQIIVIWRKWITRSTKSLLNVSLNSKRHSEDGSADSILDRFQIFSIYYIPLNGKCVCAMKQFFLRKNYDGKQTFVLYRQMHQIFSLQISRFVQLSLHQYSAHIFRNLLGCYRSNKFHIQYILMAMEMNCYEKCHAWKCISCFGWKSMIECVA